MRGRTAVSISAETRPSASLHSSLITGSSITGGNLAAFHRALLGWYDQHRRDLPWRKTHDPYRIWVSEIMLQQTRVAAVLDYYKIFLDRFPSVEKLAAASDDAVLAAWSGLGYYRRARMLHQCAKELVEKHGSRFPQRAEDLLNLPGIGRYTAAALASIAFAQPVAVVDGNVERVLQRLTGSTLNKSQMWQQAQALLDDSRPGDFNQAMMELGATVCVPGEPRCPLCPIQKLCATRQSNEITSHIGAEERLRSKLGKSAPGRSAPGNVTTPPSIRQAKNIWCVLSQRNGDIRLVQRPPKVALMPDMWELPQSSQPPHPIPPSAHWRTFRHSITVTDYTVHVLRNTALRQAALANKGKWIAIDRIPQMPITGLTRKILKASGII